jgi:hypothetical protein
MSKKTTIEVDTSKLKSEVLDLAAKLETGMALDSDSGAGTENVDLYSSNLPEDLTMEAVKKVSDYNTTFIAAGAYAFGNLAVNAMRDNKKLNEASIEIKMGDKDSLSLNVQRTKEFTNALAGGEKVVKHGVVTASYDVRSGKNGGQLKQARSVIGELASAAFSK